VVNLVKRLSKVKGQAMGKAIQHFRLIMSDIGSSWLRGSLRVQVPGPEEIRDKPIRDKPIRDKPIRDM
jgi:hypothetical protein